jgi:hypothetical protein
MLENNEVGNGTSRADSIGELLILRKPPVFLSQKSLVALKFVLSASCEL